MGKPYLKEAALFAETLRWSEEMDLAPLCTAVAESASLPLVAVGSGGSLTAAHFLAGLHSKFTGRVSAAYSPFQALSFHPQEKIAAWIISAGGGNADVNQAYSFMFEREVEKLTVLCGRPESRLATSSRRSQRVDTLAYSLPGGKDGFLATNSLLAFCCILGSAYKRVFLNSHGHSLNPVLASIGSTGSPTDVLARDTIIVLHGDSTRFAAIDLESKCTEAGLVQTQLADFRNFGHGRHVWTAKHTNTTSIVALCDNNDKVLCEKTLALLPSSLPTLVMHFPGDFVEAAVSSLLSVMKLVGDLGIAKGIDPGRPGVPDYGRKLYHLRMSTRGKAKSQNVVVERKAGLPEARLISNGTLSTWEGALFDFKEALSAATFGAVVFDYDGTLVETRLRHESPTSAMMDELNRLLENGLILGIATGRGDSITEVLKAAIPKKYWSVVIVGYHNGATVMPLSLGLPPNDDPLSEELSTALECLQSNPEIRLVSTLKTSKSQLTLMPKTLIPEGRLWLLAQQALKERFNSALSVVRSTHSVDVLARGVSKVNVIEFIRREVLHADLDILKIGDRGQWPGNDYELLGSSHSLSVDEVSTCMKSCWNIAAPGFKNTDATIAYCKKIDFIAGKARWRED